MFHSVVKKKMIDEADLNIAKEQMCILNSVGAKISAIDGVHALTDITGFGLGGHLIEICEGSNVSAKLDFAKIPILEKALEYQAKGCIPGGTGRNAEAYQGRIGKMTDSQKEIVFDPQTSGGLLISVGQEGEEELQAVLKENNIETFPFGIITEKSDHFIELT